MKLLPLTIPNERSIFKLKINFAVSNILSTGRKIQDPKEYFKLSTGRIIKIINN